MKNKILSTIKIKMRKWGLRSFLVHNAKSGSKILDIGCGNQGSVFLNQILKNPICYGLDVQDYNQTEKSISLYKDYRIVEPSKFSDEIKKFKVNFDVIIINHNIEHCNYPMAVVNNAINALNVNGFIFIATPSIQSEKFPSRKGTLNFYDDITHRKPINLLNLFEINSEKMKLIYFTESYKPKFWTFIGFFVEPFSKLMRRKFIGTWDYWGFESILWMQKK